MGQRGARAVFLASKFVFPGGAIDPGDATIPLAQPLGAVCARRLADPGGLAVPTPTPAAIATAAIRELWEETGLALAQPGAWLANATTPPSDLPQIPADWAAMASAGLIPDASALRFAFRAITPPGRPRRFDARFFLAEADAVHGSSDDFSRAGDELSHLRWLPLSDARRLDLPFVTEVMLSEIARLASAPAHSPPDRVAFFENTTAPRFRWMS